MEQHANSPESQRRDDRRIPALAGHQHDGPRSRLYFPNSLKRSAKWRSDLFGVKLARMHPDVGRVLIPQARIAQRVGELARQITADHGASGAVGEVTIIPILTGAMIFCADLMRQMPMAM